MRNPRLYTLPQGLPGGAPIGPPAPVALPVPVGGPERNALAQRALGWSETTMTTDPGARGLTRRLLEHESDQFRTLALQSAPGDSWLARVEQRVDSAVTVQDFTVGNVGIALPVGAGRVLVDCRCGVIGTAALGARLSAMVSFGAPLVYEFPQLVVGSLATSIIAIPQFATSLTFCAPDATTVTVNPGLSTWTSQAATPVKIAVSGSGTVSMVASAAFCLVSFLWTIKR